MNLRRAIRSVGKKVVKATPFLRRRILSSTDYRVLEGIDEARRLQASSGGWLQARTVRRQENAYRSLIADMRKGEPRLDFAVAAQAISATQLSRPRLLEVGCGSGYYSEVFGTLLTGRVQYTGLDYSKAMIERARANYPSDSFEVGDATRLAYGDASFDIVFNGVSLMHILDYAAAIREAARVAHYSILHSVPVFTSNDGPTVFLQKYAYGAPVVEIIFSKKELMALCEQAGLSLTSTWTSIPYDVVEVTGRHSIMETYLFAKLEKA
ncbi:class I SAM-dependent methyltransferase [Bradyrhizobium guangzhouense]|uniref:Class I SAM-dependent methyltransferase n=1 Tax=Bradyrhizobium guangzhouense TaxID=1325095 RepID=A0AAE5WZD7_9BRAD|nr:class I SAM-dependent methyltransferase [Bradyrhizobium guangzhouense]QAU45934.1 class I SAM-dependent methyltransferase [Bradyrhizobium guangzhouense]